MRRQTFLALKEYLLKDRPTQQTDAVEAAEPEAVGALVLAAEVAVVPNQRDLTEMPTLAAKKRQMALVMTAEQPQWPPIPGVNLPSCREVVGGAKGHSAAASFDVAVVAPDIQSTSIKKAAVNERWLMLETMMKEVVDVAEVVAAAEAVEVSEEVCGVDHAVVVSVEVSAEASGVAVVVTEAAVCVVGVAAEVVGVAEVVDRPMVKVAPKNLKSIQQQKIKESRSTLKRTFNACVKKKSMKEHKNCFEKISVSRGYAATTKKSVALKK